MHSINSGKKKLVFAIHDLNLWGGQDRSTLEILRRLSRRLNVEAAAFSLFDPDANKYSGLNFRRVKTLVQKPFVFKAIFYYAVILRRYGFGANRLNTLIHATGACSLVSDIIQVQFLHAAWNDVKRKLPAEIESVSQGTGKKSKWYEKYQNFITGFNLTTEMLSYSKDKKYIVIAECVKKELMRFYSIPESQIEVIYHGVDTDYFRPLSEDRTPEGLNFRRSLGISSDDVVFIFVGAFGRKGLAKAIEALSHLPKNIGLKAKLLAVGQGDRQTFKNVAKSLGVSDQVIFAEHTKNILPFYQMADAFVLPTLYEPFGLVITEAMACGLCPIVSKLAGGSELITPRCSGLLIQNPVDAIEISNHMKMLIEYPELRKSMGRAAREVTERFTWDQVADRYLKVIEPLL